MVIAFVGARRGADPRGLREIHAAVLRKYPDFTFVSGGASGVDSRSEALAREHGQRCIIYPADWKAEHIADLARRARGDPDPTLAARAELIESAARAAAERVRARGHDPLAGFARNGCILALHGELCPPEHVRDHPRTDAVVAFMDAAAHGTRDTVHRSLRAGIALWVCALDGRTLPGCPCAKPEGLHAPGART